MRRTLLLFSIASILALLPSLASASPANATAANATMALNSSYAYVNYINQSGYLIFTPNLTAAYSYLNKSASTLSVSPEEAEQYAALARQSAMEQYARISFYRYYSIAIVLVYTIIMAVVLYLFMQPIRTKKKGLRREYP